MGKRRGNSEGSIYRRKGDGRWATSVSLGRAQRKTLYGRTRAEVSQKLIELQRAIADGSPITSDRLTVSAFASQWLESVKHSVRPKTWASYETHLRVSILPAIGQLRLNRLRVVELQELANQLSESHKPRSVRAYFAVLGNMLEQAVRQQVIVSNPARLVRLPRVPHEKTVVITPDEAKRFLSESRGHRLEALFILGITTGARISELLGLTWQQVDLEQAEVSVRRTLQRVDGTLVLVEPKNVGSSRRVALSGGAVAALKQHRVRQMKEALASPYWDNSLDLVFTSNIGTPLDYNEVRKQQLVPVLRRCGLIDRVWKFHQLRHVAASLALAAGMPVTAVADMLGHSTPATTLNVYAHAVPNAQREVASAMDRMLA